MYKERILHNSSCQEELREDSLLANLVYLLYCKRNLRIIGRLMRNKHGIMLLVHMRLSQVLVPLSLKTG
jgi:hypothetical protein